MLTHARHGWVVLLLLTLLAREALSSPQEWLREGLRAALNDPDEDVQIAALAGFERRGDPPPREAVLRILQREGRSAHLLQRAAVSAIAASSQVDGYAAQLIRLLKTEDDNLRRAVVMALGRLPGTATLPLQDVSTLLAHDDERVVGAGLVVLGLVAPPELVEAAVAAKLNDSTVPYSVRCNAALSLFAMGRAFPRNAEGVFAVIGDPQVALSEQCYQLGDAPLRPERIHTQLPDVADLLGAQDWQARELAATALGMMGGFARERAARLADLLVDPQENGTVRYAAGKAIGRIGGEDPRVAGRIVQVLADSRTPRLVQEGALDAITAGGPLSKEETRLLLDYLKSPDEGLRRAAAQAIGRRRSSAGPMLRALVDLLRDPDPAIRTTAVEAFGVLGEAVGVATLPSIVELLDEAPPTRDAAIRAIGKLGGSAKSQVPKLIQYLDETGPHVYAALAAIGSLGGIAIDARPRVSALLTAKSPFVRRASGQALESMGPVSTGEAVQALAPLYDVAFPPEVRLRAYILAEDKEAISSILLWVDRQGDYPAGLGNAESRRTLALLQVAWAATKALPRVRGDVERAIAAVIDRGEWGRADVSLLKQQVEALEGGGFEVAAEKAVARIERWNKVLLATSPLFLQVMFWVVVVLAYPRSRAAQAWVFFDSSARKVIALGYVDFLLSWLPWLRSRMMAPFREALLSGAALHAFDAGAFFPDSHVVRTTAEGIPGAGVRRPLREAILGIVGHVVLEGESGLGKTMVARDLARRSSRLLAFLSAAECTEGVVEGVCDKLQGTLRNVDLVSSLIYRGGLDICIDGLNEVSQETRSKVERFLGQNKHTNVLVTTQPISWRRLPASVAVWSLQPLTETQVGGFLLQQERSIDEVRPDYAARVSAYLGGVLQDGQSSDERERTLRVLSNPMDLSVVARMVARGETPHIRELQQQQYELMAADYGRLNAGQAFPLERFAEDVYAMRARDEPWLVGDAWGPELEALEAHKMVARQYTGASLRRRFRHDKIWDFFILHAFVGSRSGRQSEHLGDQRFRGVYALLAERLPLNEARALRELACEHAADTKQHEIADTIVPLVKSRSEASASTAQQG